ncbi:MAG: PmoA family protein [Saprospiraceae bacterium]|nr:PmoA family protein [Saprospiraceae bacterium]
MKAIVWIHFLIAFISCESRNIATISAPRDFPANQPAFIELELPAIAQHYQLKINALTPVVLQYLQDHQWCFIPTYPIKKNEKIFIEKTDQAQTSKCNIREENEHLVVELDGREIMRYALKTQFPAVTLPAYYQRSGFIHPLKTLEGAVLTADFPDGHVHQHGIFHAWTRSHFRDSMIDFWNQQSELGTIRHKELIAIENGPVSSGFKVALEYVAYLPTDTFVVSEEIWNVRIFPISNQYLVDWEIDQKCLGPDSLIIDEYHYGGAAFRGCERWNLPEGAYDSLFFVSTSDGKSQVDGNHSRPQWVTMYGDSEMGIAGMAMIQHRGNLEYPQPVRIHPTMPYFCFAPMVSGSFTLLAGDHYRARYRFLVFDGQPDFKVIGETSNAFNSYP